ncbi:N-acetylmuramidase domain-containing protein [Chitinivorax sp. B]|uniref:N-acetylmuramidase domain-containing protein n=1 Tax=Chitinivorax sp. B TaxID=2502235 RepID=UPI0010F51652|nr:N-acetylmuramidase domain-containing protein [Chitinivorax sp. B]
MDFQGLATPLSETQLDQVLANLGVTAPALWAVIEVETAGDGFLPSRKPRILFERHKFSAKTNHQYDQSHPDISQPTWGGYGPGGEHQYDRLNEACALNWNAACESASWGLGQVMGEQWQSLGYASIQAFVAAMCMDEGGQLDAMARFIRVNKLDLKLQSKDWQGFARSYNGPAYADNRYDIKLSQQYQKLSIGPLPDLRVRAVQLILTYLSVNVPVFNPQGVDGWLGQRTRSALAAFQAAQGLPVTNGLDDVTYTKLLKVGGFT